MVEEYDSIIRNSVWDVVPRLIEKSVVSSRWIYKLKQAEDGSVEKHKARFMAKGFSQVEGIGYEDTFGPVVRYSLIISILVVSAQMECDEKVVKSRKRIRDEGLGAHALFPWYGRLDICFDVNQLSQVMVKATKIYWKTTKNVLVYLRGTTHFGLWYILEKGVKLQGFTHGDLAGSPSQRKRRLGGIFNIGSAALSCYNRKKRSAASSSIET
eukprot:PITA_09893